jgi:AcrR family transcriptional regulator
MLHLSDYFLEMLPDGPRQERSRVRLAAAVAGAEALLVEIGPEQTSIPEIEKRSGVPRAAIYRYFPDKYALFSAMASACLGRLADWLQETDKTESDLPYPALVEDFVLRAAQFYNREPVASVLIFRGPFDRKDNEAHERKNADLLKSFQARLSRPLPSQNIAIAIEIAYACFRHGYFHEGNISPQMIAEAIRAASAYLGACTDALGD